MNSKIIAWFGAGGLTGAALGLLAHFLFHSNVTAVALVQSGKIPLRSLTSPTPQMSDPADLQPMQIIAERIKTPDFARRVAVQLGQPDLASDFMASAYGGRGRLNTRILRDAGAIEFRVEARDPQTAINGAKIVADIVVADQNRLIDPILQTARERLGEIQAAEAAESQKLSALDAQIRQASGIGDGTYLLAQRKASFESLEDLRKSANLLRIAILRAEAEAPQLAYPVAIMRSPLSSPFILMGLGSLAGIIATFLLVQFYRQFTAQSARADDIEIHLGHVSLKLGQGERSVERNGTSGRD